MEASIAENFTAGVVGGIFTVIVGHPFDTIKTRLQTERTSLYTGPIDCLKRTIFEDGFRGLYKGAAPLLAGVAPQWGLFFGGCAIGRQLIRKNDKDPITFLQNTYVGALAGAFTVLVVVPCERIKCLLQVQTSANVATVKYKNSLDVIMKLYKENGVGSLYRGTNATLLREIPSCAVKLSVYEYLKREFAGHNSKHELTPIATILAGGLAGIAYWSVCIPADVLKSILQTAPEGRYPGGLRDVFRGIHPFEFQRVHLLYFSEVIQEEGLRGLFKGFTPLMVRAFPANAACFLGVEITLAMFRTNGSLG